VIDIVPPGSQPPVYYPLPSPPLPKKRPTVKRQARIQPRAPRFVVTFSSKHWHRAYVISSVFLLVGCGLAVIVIANLRIAIKVWEMKADLQDQSRSAFSHIEAAQAAVVTGDVVKAQAEFIQAHTILHNAHEKFEQVLAPSYGLLEAIDVTGRITTARSLLEAGEKLSAVGVRTLYGWGRLQKAKVVSPDNATEPPVTLVDAIEEIQPQFQQALKDLTNAQRSMQSVRVHVLPAAMQPAWQKLQGAVPQIKKVLAEFVDQSDLMLHVLGADHQRTYLIVFQNNHEMRPTGGFIGSIAVVNVDRGLLHGINVESVYDPDGQLAEFIVPPEPLLRITPRWYMRDANWFVDYQASAKKIAEFLEKERGPSVDGVIALTPNVIGRLLEITGPIDMPEWHVQVDANNFVSLTQKLVTYDYDRTVNKPKQFLADLTPVLLNRLFQQQAGSSAKILATFAQLAQEKHILLYFNDSQLQAAVKRIGWGGQLPKNQTGVLAVNNANIGGHKSDQFMTQDIDYRSYIQSSGDVEVLVTIRRTHHGPTEGSDIDATRDENPAVKDNVVYQRVLVPAGAQLLEAKGFTPASQVPQLIQLDSSLPLAPDADVEAWRQAQRVYGDGTIQGMESGYSYFAHWVVTKPGQTTVVQYRYRLPAEVTLPTFLHPFARHVVQLVKQPGDDRTNFSIELQLPDAVRLVKTVPQTELMESVGSVPMVVSKGKLVQDVVIGAIYESE
jgi:hypothetical protein